MFSSTDEFVEEVVTDAGRAFIESCVESLPGARARGVIIWERPPLYDQDEGFWMYFMPNTNSYQYFDDMPTDFYEETVESLRDFYEGSYDNYVFFGRGSDNGNGIDIDIENRPRHLLAEFDRQMNEKGLSYATGLPVIQDDLVPLDLAEPLPAVIPQPQMQLLMQRLRRVSSGVSNTDELMELHRDALPSPELTPQRTLRAKRARPVSGPTVGDLAASVELRNHFK